MKVTAEVYWDKGTRTLNQDSVSLQEVRIQGRKVVFALVCDGIGGLEEGETASGYVAERMTEWFYEEVIDLLKRKKGKKKIVNAGLRALYGCNETLGRYGRKHNRKLGTTVTMLLLQGGKYILWHSGDTRAYEIGAKGMGMRKEQIRRLTRDHTINNRTLNRCIGSFTWKEPDIYSGTLKAKQMILLCSDGFRNRVSERQLAEAFNPSFVSNKEQIRLCMRQLAEYARTEGETDDISAISVLIC